MFLKIFLFLLLAFDSSVQASARKNLGALFKEIVGEISPRTLPSYLQSHLARKAGERLVLNGSREHELHHNDISYSHFDEELFLRIKQKGSSSGFEVGSRILPASLDTGLRNCFASGHMIPIEGKTKTRKVFVSLYPENVVISDFRNKGTAPFPLKWFSPVVESMFTPTLRTTRQRLSLLNIWHAYTAVALVGIDNDVPWKCYYGLVAPKMSTQHFFEMSPSDYPALSEQSDTRLLKDSALKLGVRERDIEEYLSGSGLQYYVAYLHADAHKNGKYIVCNLGSIFGNKSRG